MADNQEQLYNEFADIPALEAEQKRVLEIFDGVKKGIKDLSSLGIKLDGAKGLKAIADAQKQQEKTLAQLEIATKKLAEAEAKLATEKEKATRARKKQSEEDIAETLRIKEQNKERQQRIKIQQAEEGSITQLGLKLDKARSIYDKLGESQRNSTKGQTLLKFIQDTSKAFDAQRASTDRFQQRVGNYEGSAKIIVDAFERSRVKLAAVEKQFGSFSPEAKAVRGEFEALERVTSQPQFLNVSAKFGDATAEVKFFTKALIDLERRGQGNSEAANELRTNLAKLTDDIADTRAEVKALSSDSRGFDLFAGSVSFAADTFQTFAGAAVLAGASEEDAAEATKTLVAVQSVANGVKGIANELTTKGTAANKAYAFVQGLVSTAMDKTATSAKRLNASLGVIGLIVSVIGAIAVAYVLLNKSLSANEKAQKDVTKAFKEANEEIGKQVGELESLYEISQDTNQSIDDRRDATKRILEINKQNNEATGDQTKLLVDQNGVLKEQPDLIDKISESLIRQAKTKAVLGLIEKGYTALLNAQTASLTSQTNKLQDLALKGNEFINNIFGKNAPSLSEVQQGIKDRGVNDAQIYLDSLKTILSEGLKSGDLDLGGVFSSSPSSKPDNKKDDIAKKNKAAILALAKIRLEAEAGIQKQILQIETFSFAERQNALENYVRIKSQIIKAEADFEKSEKGKTAKEIELIDAQTNQRITELSDEAIKLFTITAKETVTAVVDEIGEMPDEVKAVYDKMEKDFKEWSDKLLGILTETQKKAIDEITKAFDVKEQLLEVENIYIDTFQNIAATAGDLISGIFDGQKNKIQDQIDEIERLKAAEIDRINASGDSEEKKAARVKLIESKAQADREKLELRQRQIDRQRAIAAKALSVFQLSVDGIQAVTKAKLLATEARLKFLAAGGPANPAAIGFGIAAALAQAQVLQTIIASGAAVALAAATPIPKFFKGKKATDSYTGPGIVGDKGRELGISKAGQVTLYSKPTLTHLMSGDTILPNKVTEDILASMSLSEMAKMNNVKVPEHINNNDEVVKQLKELNKKSRIIINNEKDITSTAWYDYHFKH